MCGNIISAGDGLRVCASVQISHWRRSFWTRQPTHASKGSTAGHDAELKSLTVYFDSWTECVRDFITDITLFSVYQLLHGSASLHYVTLRLTAGSYLWLYCLIIKKTWVHLVLLLITACLCQVMPCRTHKGGECVCCWVWFLFWDQKKTSVDATEAADVNVSQDAHGSMQLCRCQIKCVCFCVR